MAARDYLELLIDQDGSKSYLLPALLEPAWQNWEQQEFQALWCNIIGEQCSALRPITKWQYSTGSAEEFVHSQQLRLGFPRAEQHTFMPQEDAERGEERVRNMRAFDGRGNEIELRLGRELIAQAVQRISRVTEPPERLVNCIELLDRTESLLQQGFYQGVFD
jgi:hypothetical protein